MIPSPLEDAMNERLWTLLGERDTMVIPIRKAIGRPPEARFAEHGRCKLSIVGGQQ